MAASRSSLGPISVVAAEATPGAKLSASLSATVALGYIHAKYDTFSRFVPAGAPNPLNPSTTLATGQIIDAWDNPFSGERVEVVHVANDPVNTVLSAPGREVAIGALPISDAPQCGQLTAGL